MLKIAALLLLPVVLPAADIPIAETDALRIEKAQLEVKLIELQFEQLRLAVELLKTQYAAKQAEVKAVQDAAYLGAKVKPEEYNMDLEKRVFIPKPAVKTPPKQ